MRRAEEDLAVIRRIMEESRREVGQRGRHFVIWGGITTVGLIATYMSALGRATLDPDWVWVVLLVVGWSASMILGLREGRRSRVRTLGRRILTGTWMSIAVTLTLIGLSGMFGEVVSHWSLPGLLAVVIASPVLVTALMTGERWLVWVAVGWWLGGALMLFVPGLYTLPLMAFMALLLLAVPGGVLNVRSRAGEGPERRAA